MLAEYNNLTSKYDIPSFQSRLPKGKFSDMRAIPHLRCPICNNFMLTKKEIESAKGSVHKPVLYYGKKLSVGRIAIRELKKYKSDLPEDYQEYIDIMDRYTKMYPDKSLSEIMKDERLNYYHNMMANQLNPNFEKKVKKSFKEYDRICSKLPQEDRKIFISTVHDTDGSSKLRMTLFEPVIVKVGMYDSELAKRIEKWVMSHPVRRKNGHSIWKKYSERGYSDEEIIENILTRRENTFQHIKADKKGGKAKKGNGICMCTSCNQSLGTASGYDVLRVFPEFAERTRSQISRITSFIKSGQLKGYDDYPIEVESVLKKEAGINIRTGLFLKDMSQIIKNRCEKRKRKIGNISREIEAMSRKINAMSKKVELLQQEKNKLAVKNINEFSLANRMNQILNNKKSSK